MQAAGHCQKETCLVGSMWEVLGEESRQLWLRLRSEGCTAHGVAGHLWNCSCQSSGLAPARTLSQTCHVPLTPGMRDQNISPRHSFACPLNAFGVIWKYFYIAFFYLNPNSLPFLDTFSIFRKEKCWVFCDGDALVICNSVTFI